jgi:UDP-N-acetylglucosamine--N-acetylmuramyl-(pentapeptide) pyrophosphoryl-undecaprenol N-acetylglucosamine transferase
VAGKRFLMAGGGTGGHVMPLLAVAEELRGRGHEALFVGTKTGFEARLVPARGFGLEWIEIGGFQGAGWKKKAALLYQLPLSVLRCYSLVAKWKPSACFSLGGYVAAPPVIAALLRGVPVVVMEPNAMPGLVNRWLGKLAKKALLSFEEAADYFPEEAVELTGLPVREEFFRIEEKRAGDRFRIFITGGSQGSNTLNRAARESWPLFAASEMPVEIVHQCGRQAGETLATDFGRTGLKGQVTAFVENMAGELAAADLVICRSGAGTLGEVMAAGRASVLVPFPFAADDHQTRNAKSMVDAGAAWMVSDGEWTGKRMFEVVSELMKRREALEKMAQRARDLRKTGAAQRAATLLEELAGNAHEIGGASKSGIDNGFAGRNN